MRRRCVRWEVGGGRVEREVKCKRDRRWRRRHQKPFGVCVLLCFVLLYRYWGIVTVPGSIPYGSRPGVAGSSPSTLTTSLAIPVTVNDYFFLCSCFFFHVYWVFRAWLMTRELDLFLLSGWQRNYKIPNLGCFGRICTYFAYVEFRRLYVVFLNYKKIFFLQTWSRK